MTNTAQIRQALNNAFDDSGLRAFCLDYFPDTYDKFGDGMGKAQKITLLLDHSRRSPARFSSLLDAVQQAYKLSDGKRDELKPLIEALEAPLEPITDIAEPSKSELNVQKVVQDTQEAKLEHSSTPKTLGEIIQREPDCARILQRQALMQKIVNYFEQEEEPEHFIVLCSETMIGRTKILKRLSKRLEGRYAPLMVTGQGIEVSTSLHDLDAFVFYFADQLTNEFRKWAKRHGLNVLEDPKWNDFKQRSSAAFERHWSRLRQIAHPCQPLLIFDEIERLLDFTALDPRILTFLDYFVTNPDHGFFILAGSERMEFSENEKFRMLIAKGRYLKVNYYHDKTVLTIFSQLKKYFAYEAQLLQYCLTLCDGHSRVLHVLIENTLSLIRKLPSKQSIGKEEFERILTAVLQEISQILWVLRRRLSKQELFAIQLISQRRPRVIDKPEIYLHELVTLAVQKFPHAKLDYNLIRQGVVDLERREWVAFQDWNQQLFRFKLGIFLVWLERYPITSEEVGQ